MTSGQELFDEYNRKYFRGRLRRYEVRFVRFDGAEEKWLGVYGYCDRERHIIFIREHLPSRLIFDRKQDTVRQEPMSVDEVLLHEMCHIQEGTHFSRRFRVKLRQLAAAGENWAGKEADEYDQLPTWNEQMRLFRRQLNEFASEHPRPDFHLVVRRLAGRDALENDFLRKLPWLRAAWNAACRAIDE